MARECLSMLKLLLDRATPEEGVIMSPRFSRRTAAVCAVAPVSMASCGDLTGTVPQVCHDVRAEFFQRLLDDANTNSGIMVGPTHLRGSSQILQSFPTSLLQVLKFIPPLVSVN